MKKNRLIAYVPIMSVRLTSVYAEKTKLAVQIDVNVPITALIKLRIMTIKELCPQFVLLAIKNLKTNFLFRFI